MRISTKAMTLVITLGGLSLAAGQAMAGCGFAEPGTAGKKPMVYRNDGTGRLFQVDFPDFYGPFRYSRITGLWKFVFSAKGDTGPGAPSNAIPMPDGATVDAGFVTWHDDGTELMNSGRTPASGSFCMGVWKQTGPRTYELNHWALSWIPDYEPGQTQSWSQNPAPGSPGLNEIFKALGPANIQETITLSKDGNSYAGTFSLTQYVNDGSQAPINDTDGVPVAFVVLGTISATRVTVQ